MQKITPFLWFDNNAEEAMDFYVSIFNNSEIIDKNYIDGKLFTGTFQIDGQNFYVLNGGPVFKFSQAISFFINCEDQKEVDDLWQKLSDGGEEQNCGWVKDKFGISWQVVPSILSKLLNDSDKDRSGRVMQAMLKMKKIIIEDLKNAYDNK